MCLSVGRVRDKFYIIEKKNYILNRHPPMAYNFFHQQNQFSIKGNDRDFENNAGNMWMYEDLIQSGCYSSISDNI